jgi:riboflavin biosynthesis pyrimidine reductase
MGYHNMLLVGGSEIFRLFLEYQLVNYLFVTMEPFIFGQGTPMIQLGDALNTPLHLEEVSQLNTQGTLLLKYRVKESK